MAGQNVTDRRPVLWIVAREFGVGSEVWILRQIAALRHFRPVVVTWVDHRSPEIVAAMDVPVHVLPFPADLASGPDRWINRLKRVTNGNFYGAGGAEKQHLIRLAQADRPAVILAHFGHTALRLLPVAQALSVPLVCHFHGLDLSSALKNRWYRWSLLRHMSAFSGVITVGTRQRSWVANHYPRPDALHLIPCGVPVAEFSRQAGEAFMPSDPPLFVTVSRLVPQKGVEWCLRALALLPRGMAKMSVVGDGPERPRLEAMAQDLGIAKEVVFLGAQPPAGVRQALVAATALLQHSLDAPDGWYEGFGVTVAEASAMEVPTIASRCGGLMDQVIDQETGILVDQRNAPALAEAMRRLVTEAGVRDRMGRAARVRAVQDFDTKGQVAKLEAALFAAITAKR